VAESLIGIHGLPSFLLLTLIYLRDREIKEGRATSLEVRNK